MGCLPSRILAPSVSHSQLPKSKKKSISIMAGLKKVFLRRTSKPKANVSVIEYEPAPWVNSPRPIFRVDEKHPDGGELI